MVETLKVMKKSLADFKINNGDIPVFIDDISKSISVKRKVRIEKTFKSVYDFTAILYYFRFVEKLEKSEIAKMIGLQQVQPVHIHLYNFGWHYSNDYLQNKKEYEFEITELQDIFKQAKNSASKLIIDKHPKLSEALSKKDNFKRSYIKIFTSPEEYIKTMYQLIYINSLTTLQLVILFKIPYTTLQLKIKNLGFNHSLKEAMVKKKENKRQNYEKTMRSGKTTRLNSRMETLSDSTKNETYARELFDKYVYDYFESNVYDVIVGINNIGILSHKEVDIPIVIHNRVQDNLYKFVIEYNGNPYHNDEKDFEKKKIALNRGWIYVAILEESNGYSSNNPKVIKRQVRELCNELKKVVEGK